jgi:hypothetical protein
LFSETTGYVALDKRIAKTKAKKDAFVSVANEIPQLADLIAQQAGLRQLNASWESV